MRKFARVGPLEFNLVDFGLALIIAILIFFFVFEVRTRDSAEAIRADALRCQIIAEQNQVWFDFLDLTADEVEGRLAQQRDTFRALLRERERTCESSAAKRRERSG